MGEKPEIGISTAAFYPDYLTEEALNAIDRFGFRSVEVFLQADEEYTVDFGVVLDRRRRELDLEVHSLHLYTTYFDLWVPYARMAEEVRDRYLPFVGSRRHPGCPSFDAAWLALRGE